MGRKKPSPHTLPVVAGSSLAVELGLDADILRVQEIVAQFVDETDPEMSRLVRWQLEGNPKYFRPITVLACARAMSEDDTSAPENVLNAAAAIEIFHNITLVADDIVDHSRWRRGKQTLHCRFGTLSALMTTGYLAAGLYRLLKDDSMSALLCLALTQRLAVAECSQWRLRRRPLSTDDWRRIASEDTGSMFETCARLGCRDDSLASFGMLLGILYHGCDDVADIPGSVALGGGGNADIRDES